MEQINKELDEENGQALKMFEALNQLKEEREKLNLKISESIVDLKEACNHSRRIRRDHYIPGSYLNRGEYVTEILCSICNKELNRTSVDGGYG